MTGAMCSLEVGYFQIWSNKCPHSRALSKQTAETSGAMEEAVAETKVSKYRKSFQSSASELSFDLISMISDITETHAGGGTGCSQYSSSALRLGSGWESSSAKRSWESACAGLNA